MSTHYKELLSNIKCPSYAIYLGGMGCRIYYRRIDNESDIEHFFMHSDAWGQYVVDDRPALNEFIEGYEFIGQCESDY